MMDITLTAAAMYREALRRIRLMLLLALTTLLFACSSPDDTAPPADGSTDPTDIPGDPSPDPDPGPDPGPEPDPDPEPNPEPGPDPDPDPEPVDMLFKPGPDDLQESAAPYQQDGYGTIDILRADVRTVTTPGLCEIADYSGCTFEDVLADISNKDDYKPRINVHFQSEDFADDGTVNNAELRQRGGSTRLAPQKSFRIKLDDKDTLWRAERSLLLNKHPNERSRIRNKLAFDLMSEIPHLMSSRTQFVNLWIDNGSGPQDYGLFTHVEAPGSNYLDKRGLNRDDRLYKAEFFRFHENDLKNVQVDAAGKPLDQDLFELSLEIEAGDDHRSLVAMLTAFHDPALAFDAFLDEYFNRNNVLTWMAVNILLYQTDAVTHNFILYNPLGSKKFYFLPWDYDGSFHSEIEPGAEDFSNSALQKRLFYGYARAVNSEFIDRYLRLPGAHERLVEAAQFIRNNYLTDSHIAERANQLVATVLPMLQQLPDSEFNPGYDQYRADSFPKHVADNLEALKTRFSVPMPPELDEEPELIGENWLFAWTPAFDVTGHNLSYELQISTSLLFEPDNIVVAISGIADAPERIEQKVAKERLLPGDHYVRVIARADNEPERFWQISSNVLRDGGQEYYGAVRFTVP